MPRSRAWRYIGLWAVLFVVFTAIFTAALFVLRGGPPSSPLAPSVPPTITVPDSIAGLWQRVITGEGTATMYYLFIADAGEFRLSDDLDMLYDNPILVGAYTYQPGQLTLHEDATCPTPGVYTVQMRQFDGASSRLDLTDPTDDCIPRQTVLGQTTWARVNSEDN